MGSRVPGRDASDRRDVGLARVADRIALASGAAFALALAFLALNQPWVSDDFSGAVFLRNHPALWDCIVSGYTTWTGRFAGSAFSWLTLQIRPAYGIVIWLGMALLVVLTFAVARGRFPRLARADLYVVALLAVAFWYGLPAIEETVFWTAGSVVYLWPAVAGLAFLYPYRRWAEDAGNRRSGGLRALAAVLGMFVLGICVGGSQEQLLVACLLYVGIIAVRAARDRRLARTPAHLYAGVVGLVAAGAISLSAPGNGVRLDAVPATGLGGTFIAALKFLVHVGIEWLPPLVPWIACLALLAVPLTRASDGEGRETGPRSDWWVWALLGLATISPFLIQPYFGAERTVMFLAVFLVVAAVSLGTGTAGRVIDRVPALVASAAIAALLLITTGDMALSGLQARSLKAGQRARAEEVERQKEAGISDVTVPPISVEPPRRGVIWGDGTADPSFWVNDVMAGWYEVSTITVTDAPQAAPEGTP